MDKESKIITIKVIQEWEDSFMIAYGDNEPQLYLREDYSIKSAICDYLMRYMSNDYIYYALTPSGQIVSSIDRTFVNKDKFIASLADLMGIIDTLLFSISKDGKECIISSTMSPSMKYVIEEKSNEEMILHYITNVLGYTLPDNIVIPEIQFNDN